MKRHLHCAEQLKSPSNLTKCCACHQILSSRFERERIILRAGNRHLAPAALETLLVPPWRRISYGKTQSPPLRLSPKISRNPAPATKSDTPTSPNIAPATKNESHDGSSSHMTCPVQCAEPQDSSPQFAKYCAGHKKMNLMMDPCLTWNVQYNARSIRSHHPTSPNTAPATKNHSNDWSPSKRRVSFTMRGTTKVTLDPHEILRLPLKIILLVEAPHIWSVIYNARSN